MNAVRYVLHFMQAGRAVLVFGAVLAVVSVLAGLGLLASAGWLIAASAVAGAAFNLFAPSAGVRGFAVLRVIGRYFERLVTHDATLAALARLRAWFFRRCAQLGPAALSQRASGDVLDRMMSDIQALDGLYLRVLIPGFVAAIAIPISLAAIYVVAPVAALITAGLLAVAAWIAPSLAMRATRRPSAEVAQATARLRATAIEGARGRAELACYGGGVFLKRAELESDAVIRAEDRMFRVEAVQAAFQAAFGLLGLLLAASAAALVVGGPRAALTAFAALAAFEAANAASGAFERWPRVRVAAERVTEIGRAADAAVAADSHETAPTAGPWTLRFEQVTFTYPNTKEPALKDVSFDAPAQQVFALVGASGSGKSTILDLVLAFRTAEVGAVRLCGADIRAWPKAALRNEIAYVAQTGETIAGSIRENLLLGDPEADSDAMWRALETADLAGVVRGRPDGLDAWIGEGGLALSGGELRRLAVARAALKRSAHLLLLDEPTAGLSRSDRARVIEGLQHIVQGKTTLLASHDPDVLALASEGILLRRGHLAGAGAPLDLWAQNAEAA